MQPQVVRPPEPTPELPPNAELSAKDLTGILGYVGTTGVGKTYLAKEHLLKLHKSGVPCVVIDGATVANFDDIPHVQDAREVAEALWGSREAKLIAWTPKTVDEFDSLMRAIQAARGERGIAILIDEITFWKKSAELPFLFRTWRHSKTTILVTSQHVSADLGQVLFGCNPRIFIFRTTAPRSLEWFLRWHGLDPDKIRALPDRTYLVHRF